MHSGGREATIEPMTDTIADHATMREVTAAEIEHECTNPRVAKLTPELSQILETVERDDLIDVEHHTPSGLHVRLVGRVVDVTREFGDMHIATNRGEAYLHINPENGTYYFDDDNPKCPDDGLEIQSVTLLRDDR